MKYAREAEALKKASRLVKGRSALGPAAVQDALSIALNQASKHLETAGDGPLALATFGFVQQQVDLAWTIIDEWEAGRI